MTPSIGAYLTNPHIIQHRGPKEQPNTLLRIACLLQGYPIKNKIEPSLFVFPRYGWSALLHQSM